MGFIEVNCRMEVIQSGRDRRVKYVVTVENPAIRGYWTLPQVQFCHRTAHEFLVGYKGRIFFDHNFLEQADERFLCAVIHVADSRLLALDVNRYKHVRRARKILKGMRCIESDKQSASALESQATLFRHLDTVVSQHWHPKTGGPDNDHWCSHWKSQVTRLACDIEHPRHISGAVLYPLEYLLSDLLSFSALANIFWYSKSAPSTLHPCNATCLAYCVLGRVIDFLGPDVKLDWFVADMDAVSILANLVQLGMDPNEGLTASFCEEVLALIFQKRMLRQTIEQAEIERVVNTFLKSGADPNMKAVLRCRPLSYDQKLHFQHSLIFLEFRSWKIPWMAALRQEILGSKTAEWTEQCEQNVAPQHVLRIWFQAIADINIVHIMTSAEADALDTMVLDVMDTALDCEDMGKQLAVFLADVQKY